MTHAGPESGAPPNHGPEPELSVGELVDALLLFDEPILNTRYHGMLARYPDDALRDKLIKLPMLVLESEREARLGAAAWSELGVSRADTEFSERAQQTLLDSFLTLAENQLRLSAFLSRNAPTARVRAHFDQMAHTQREVARQLREAMVPLSDGEGPHLTLRSVQEENNNHGSLRERLEHAIRSARAAGLGIRAVRLSHVALRHLRDQGLFHDHETTLLDVPVVIDLSWEASAFALEGYDIVPLEEIMGGLGRGNDASARRC